MNIINLIDNISENINVNIETLSSILNSNIDEANYLFNKANNIRKHYCGDEIHLRAIIEFSNYCKCQCEYCGLNSKNTIIKRYRMSLDEIILNAKEAFEAGYKTIVLQSGEDLWYTKDKISYIIKSIKSIGDIAITLSVGERSYEEYKQWKRDGANRFLIKHETANENLYNKLHPHSNFKNRIRCLKWLNELNYQTGSGFMIDLPGQTIETIAKDILLLKDLNVHMAGIGPFIPHPCTKLKNYSQGSLFTTLKAIAISRIILKRVHLPATTALGVITNSNIIGDFPLYNKEQILPFNCGANVLMKKIEPYKYRRLYDIYPKPQGKIKTIKEEREETEKFIKSIGRQVGLGRGDSLKLHFKLEE